jgi:flagellar biosynthesis protein FlhF
MNVRRFVGKNAREAIAQARGVWGDQAVVLSNRAVDGGVEIVAMAGTDVPALAAPTQAAARATPARGKAAHVEPMSTLSFQQFVRERNRLAEPPQEPGRFAAQALNEELHAQARGAAAVVPPAEPLAAPAATPFAPGAHAFAAVEQSSRNDDVMEEIKSMRGMIASQLAGMAWFDTVRRSPAQTQALRLMIGNGFSPQLARQLVHRIPESREHDNPGTAAEHWLLNVLSRNLRCAGEDTAVLEQGGVFAVVGPTGVGKTTTTAKLAAHFALKHGAGSVGLITVDTYRMGASDQLRAFGRILNIPVHTARDSASLTDLLNLFDRKKLVLIDTVGVGQRDSRVADLLASLPAQRVQRLLALNASAQAETLEEVVHAYGAKPGTRCVFTKLDEAVKSGAVIDVAIRHQLVVEGFANGQRVPEDWHAARAQLLVQKALMKPAASIFAPDDSELGLLLTAPHAMTHNGRGAQHV